MTMFSYQCRYCKVAFDQWGKLVTHRRDEHSQEFEALQVKYELFLRKQQVTNNTPIKEPGTEIQREALNGLRKSSPLSFSTLNKMKPHRRSFHHAPSPPLAPVNKTPSKEVDLENKEISLCVPTSGNRLNGSFQTSPSDRLGPIFPYPTPPSSSSRSIFQNGNVEAMREFGRTPCSVLTPPMTPSPLSLAEELVLNLKWEVPLSKKRIFYHQMDDEAEIEFSTIPPPSGGPRVSLTRHSNPDTGITSRLVSTNGHHLANTNGEPEGRSFSSPKANHVVIEKLEDELHITCSKSGESSNGPRLNDAMQGSSSRRDTVQGSSNKSTEMKPSEVLPSSGKCLGILHSRLKLQNRNSQRLSSINYSRTSSRINSPGNGSSNAEANVSNRNRVSRTRTCTGSGKAKTTNVTSSIPRASRRRPTNK